MSAKAKGVKVVVRFRPPRVAADATDDRPEMCVRMADYRTAVLRNPRHPDQLVSYRFDRVFGPDAKQEDVFEQVKPFVAHAASGRNATIFAYGPTGSGKTHTMQGTDERPGVIPRAVAALLTHVEAERAGGGEWTDHQVYMSYFELYKEKVWDLVEPKKADLPIRETAGKTIVIPGLAEVPVASVEHFNAVFADALAKRRVAPTNLNTRSSRSHAVLLVKLCKKSVKNPRHRVQAKLHLIDLAGSEDNRKTGNRGNALRLQESGAINSSLFVLNKVVDAINAKAHRIPYRDSKLTRLLQDSLGGSAYSCMVVNADPAPEQMQEMQNCLQFASKSRDVVNVPMMQTMVAEVAQPTRHPVHPPIRSHGGVPEKKTGRKAPHPPGGSRGPRPKPVAPKAASARNPRGITRHTSAKAPVVNVDVKVLSQIEAKLAKISTTMVGPDADTEARLARLEALFSAHAAAGGDAVDPVSVAEPAPTTAKPKVLEPEQTQAAALAMTPRSRLQVAKAKILEAKAYEKSDPSMAVRCYREAEVLLPEAAQRKIRAKIDELEATTSISESSFSDAFTEPQVAPMVLAAPAIVEVQSSPRAPLQALNNRELVAAGKAAVRKSTPKRTARAMEEDDDSGSEWAPSDGESVGSPTPARKAKKRRVKMDTSHWQPSAVVASATAERTEAATLADEARSLLLSALNTATEKQLMTFKGVGKKRAQSIVQFRDAQRSFSNLDDLRHCGFGDKLLQSFVESNVSAIVPGTTAIRA